MIHVIFKNLDRSDLLQEAVVQRVSSLYDKFPQLKNHRISCTLKMANSPFQAGPEQFNVKIQIHEGPYKGIGLERKSMNLHKSLADSVDRMHERLKRHDEKKRKNQRSFLRKKKDKILFNTSSSLSPTTDYFKSVS